MPTVIRDHAARFAQHPAAFAASRLRDDPAPAPEGLHAEALAGLLEMLEQMPPGATVSASAMAALLALALDQA